MFHRDDLAESLHFVVRGRFAVRVPSTPVGDNVLLDVVRPGRDAFGELALLARRRAPQCDGLGARGRRDAVGLPGRLHAPPAKATPA